MGFYKGFMIKHESSSVNRLLHFCGWAHMITDIPD